MSAIVPSGGGAPLPIIGVPPSFANGLASGDGQLLVETPVNTTAALFGRALCHAEAGDRARALADFEAAEAEIGDPCRVEIAIISLNTEAQQESAVELANRITGSPPDNPLLLARAHHLGGLARYHLRHNDRAIDHLLQAIAGFSAAGDRVATARARDSLGMVHTASGHIEDAASAYALSLAEKTLAGDHAGVALTIGNLGRLHLAGGRFAQALTFFTLNHELCTRLGDSRSARRAMLSMARALVEEGDGAGAAELLLPVLKDLADGVEPVFSFYAHELLARARILENDLNGVEAQVETCRVLLLESPEPSRAAVLSALEGLLAWAAKIPAAAGILETAVASFSTIDLPEAEIDCRRNLSGCLREAGRIDEAADCLITAIKLAREKGLHRQLRPLSEALLDIRGQTGTLKTRSDAGGFEEIGDADGYQLLELAGRGAFGTVYRAYDPVGGREVAYKTISLDAIYDVQQRRRLIESAFREIQAARNIEHPGVERVHAIGRRQAPTKGGDDVGDTTGGGLYIVKEFIHGIGLDEAIALHRDKLDPATLLRDIAHALSALHEAGIIHRDLKPANILLRDRDALIRPVLIDFGLAARPADLCPDDTAGTALYAAPEQRAGQPLTPAADLYALGIIGCELLTGAVPRDRSARDDRKLLRGAARAAQERPDARHQRHILDALEGLMQSAPESRRHIV
jgi:tetratricopeptide (TPR) repeat protein